MDLLGTLGSIFGGEKRVPKNTDFLMPPFSPTLPKKVPKMSWKPINKRNRFRPFLQASAQVLPDPLKSMNNDLPDMLFQRFRGVCSHVFLHWLIKIWRE